MPPAKTRSRDRSSLPKYRVELPILLDDMNLSVYAFRLYVHLKRVAERSEEGSCWESARTLAQACNMSSGQVSKAKDELEKEGLITRHIKMMRGGVGDDITIVDIWPQNFARYGPERGPGSESDHHTITSNQKVITTRSLSESDHHTITSGESDQEVITLTSKRSYSDPIDHDQYHIESLTTPPTPTAHESKNGGGGDFFFELRRRGVGKRKAQEIAAKRNDPENVLHLIDARSGASPPDSPAFGRLINDILDGVAGGYVAPAAAPKNGMSTPLPTKPNMPDAPAPVSNLMALARARRQGTNDDT